MLPKPTTALTSGTRRAWAAWKSTDVSTASLSSLSFIAAALFLEAVGFFVWKLADDRLQAIAASLGFIGVLVGTPAAIGALGFDPIVVGRRRVAVANQLRRVGRNGIRMLAPGLSILIAIGVLIALHTRVPRESLPLFEVAMFLGATLAGAGATCILLPRRLVAPLPDNVDIMSPLELMRTPRAEAICGSIAIALFALSELVSLASST
jgi:hypothetical protein